MKKLTFILLLICSLISLTIFPNGVFAQTTNKQTATETTKAASTAASDESVDDWMPDKVLQNAVAKKLSISDPSTITKDDMKKLTALSFTESESALSSLEGLQYAPNFYYLYIPKSNVSDITPLENLTKMQTLYLMTSNVSDISPLKNLTNITNLHLDRNPITDYSPLSNLVNLIEFGSRYSNITDASFLKNATNLKRLYLWSNNISDLSFLDNLSNLQFLELSYNKVDNTALEHISGLKNLTTIYLSANNISDVSALKTLTNLTSLTISSNYIADISALESLPLTTLNARQQTINLDKISIKGKTYMQNGPITGLKNNQTIIAPYPSEGNEGTVKYTGIEWTSFADEGTLHSYWNETYDNANMQFSGNIYLPYERAEGETVTVKYVDENGDELAQDTTLQGKIGDDYTTEAKEIANATLQQTPDNAKGTFKDTAQTVTYVYERDAAAPVTVRYLDEDGNSLAKETTLNGKIGDHYQSEPKTIDGWVLTETPDNAKGTFKTDDQTVTYVYEKANANANPVTVRYLDKDGNSLAKETILQGRIGDDYATSPKKIANWTLIKTPDNAKGIFKNTDQTVTYRYEKVDAAPVTVHYRDKNGNSLAKTSKLSGKIGDNYQTKAKKIDGWVLTKTPNNASGIFKKATQTVTYVYEKADEVIIRYLDKDGNKIAETTELEGRDGANYTTLPKKIDGWILVKAPNNANGTFKKGEQTVTYIYKKVDTNTANVNTSNHKSSGDVKKTTSLLPSTGDKLLDILLYSAAGIILIILALLLFRKKKPR